MIQISSEQTVRNGILPLQPDTMFNPLKRDDMGYYDDETYNEYNGTYVQDVEGWSDIVAVAAGSGFTVGLKNDGTLVCAGKGPVQTENVTNVLAIAAGVNCAVAMKLDGSVAVLAENAPELAWDLQ